jgi:hypothetical protein
MKDWGCARGRMEAEISRKKEHINVATNFAKVRGWTRSSFKTKNHKPNTETFDQFIEDSSEEEVEVKIK